MALLCAGSYVKFIKGFSTPAPQESVERKTSALCQGAVSACSPGRVNDVGRGKGDYCFNLQGTRVCGGEDGGSAALLALCATDGKLGCVSIGLHRGVLGEAKRKPQQAGGVENSLVPVAHLLIPH